MRAVDIIIKKRDGHQLSAEEIEYFILGYANGEIPDYQAAAWAMAVMLNGMTAQETTDLTLAIAASGDQIDLTGIVPIAVDKHSTGGVGDKTTLVVAPIVAACGLAVGKMSGRGLGFSGGTLDKLESIPGFRCNLSTREFLKQVKEIGLVITGQSVDLAPADGKLYALRDVTGTVQSIPLIASSVISKKLAGGAHAIVLDVKCGVGAFMETVDDARRLASLMVEIAHLAGRKSVAIISDMNQPLGYAVGNAIEIKEAIDTLHGGGPEDFRAHCLEIASHMLKLGNVAANVVDAREKAESVILNGLAWKKFREFVAAQGGDVSYVDDPSKLASAKLVETISAPQNGYLEEVNARIVGESSVILGGGREKKGDPIDYGVGVMVHKKVGDQVGPGDSVFTIYANDENKFNEARQHLDKGFRISEAKVEKLPYFYDVVQ